jgi:D-alanyl-D-alanine carboxypeptidase
MINPSRLATAAVLCELGIVVCVAGASSADLQKAAPPTLNRLAPLLAADIAPATPQRHPAIRNPAVASVDIVKTAELLAKQAAADATPLSKEMAADPKVGELSTGTVTDATPVKTATDTPAVANEPKPVVVASLTDQSEVLPSETPSVAAATASPTDPAATPTTPDPAAASGVPDAVAKDVRDDVSSVEIFDECFVADACIDRYLWALYKRTPKQDSVKEDEQRKVTVKRKGKMVTVTKTFSRVVDEDFAWKDPKAADKAGLMIMDYVIGGMDRSFKLRLFNMLRAAQAAGMSPGITSAFRDDYRQSIASGLHAASDRSYHGGSSRGGYGHGLAADVVSVNGATRALRQAASENFWKWIDTHGREFGIGRPYLDRDPPHVGPIDGEEYAKHRGTATARAASNTKDRKAGRAEAGTGKRSKLARS